MIKYLKFCQVQNQLEGSIFQGLVFIIYNLMSSQEKIDISEGIRKSLYICFVWGLLFPSSFARASVFEFNNDGTVDVYEAHDYLSAARHQPRNHTGNYMWSQKLYQPQSDLKYNDLIKENAERHQVSIPLIHAIIRAESSYNADAISPKGAGGLMQLMPDTAKRFGVFDMYSPAENISGGTQYLKFLLNHYHGDVTLAVAAYNAGEGNVDKYGDIPPFAETRTYVNRVMSYLDSQQASNE